MTTKVELGPSPEEIATSRLKLRPLQSSDAADIYRIRNVEDMKKWSKPFESLENAENYTRRLVDSPNDLAFVILLPESQSESGSQPPSSTTTTATATTTTTKTIGLIHGSPDNHELSYDLHPIHWNQGLMTEALSVFLPAYFARFPGEARVLAMVEPGNDASARVLDKAGFRLERRNVRRRPTFSLVDRDEVEVSEVRSAVVAMGLQPSTNPPPDYASKTFTEYVYEKGGWLDDTMEEDQD